MPVHIHIPIGGLINRNSIVGCTGCRWRPVYNTRAWVPTLEQWAAAHPPVSP
jgi:hypothetical protein